MGDFDGDGMDEFVISADGWNSSTGKNYFYQYDQGWPINPFMTVQGDTQYIHYGWFVSNVGDINDDDLPDLGIPEGYGANTDGRLDIYLGSTAFDTLPDWVLYPHDSTEAYGGVLDSCGDINGDDATDFVMLATYNSTALEIFHGGQPLDSIADWILTPTNMGPHPLGDVNADGYADIMTRGTYVPVRIYFGGNPMDTIPDMFFYEYSTGGGGQGMGDVNGDTYPDFCINMHFPDSSQSHSALYFGGPDVDAIPDVLLQNRFGELWSTLHVITSGDFNGDGYNDVVSATGDLSLGDIVYIYLGGPWFNPLPDAWVTIYSIIFDFGYTVSTGDVNGDGRDELLVTAQNYGNFNRGRVYLYEGPETWIDSGAAVEPEELRHYPGWFKLNQNYPNPFNATTSVHFELGKPSLVNLSVYDLKGRKVKELITSQNMSAGGYNIAWTSKNEADQTVSSGIYVLQLKVDHYQQIRKMALLR